MNTKLFNATDKAEALKTELLQSNSVDRCFRQGCCNPPQAEVGLESDGKTTKHRMCMEHFVEAKQIAEDLTKFEDLYRLYGENNDG